jgi:hypothetical protein
MCRCRVKKADNCKLPTSEEVASIKEALVSKVELDKPERYPPMFSDTYFVALL